MRKLREVKHRTFNEVGKDEAKKVLLVIPKDVLKDADRITQAFNPDLFYNRSHYFTCALIKLNREMFKQMQEVKK